MGLQPPAGSGAISLQPAEIVVTENGQTVYMLASLAYKVGNAACTKVQAVTQLASGWKVHWLGEEL